MAVTVDQVKAIFPSSLTDEQLGVALEIAQMIVAEQLVGKVGCNMSESRLDKITIFLTAHFAEATANMVDGMSAFGLKRSKLGEADESYAVPAEALSGFHASRWGQLALALDTCGVLVSLGTSKLTAKFQVVEPSQSGLLGNRFRY